MSEAGQDDRQIDYASVQAAIEAGVRLCEESRGHHWEQRSGYPHRSCRWCGAFEVVFDLESRTQKRAVAERDELRAALRDLVAAARRVNAQWPMISDAAQVEGTREAILAMADLDDALRAYDRARAAGVEVTGHE